MTPYHDDLAANVRSTIHGGVDLVLASWNPDVAYAVIAALLSDRGDTRALRQSDERLARDRRIPE